ncbi:MAG: AAA family ATPase [Pseudomonadota bacterium]
MPVYVSRTEAASILQSARRVLVIGCSGVGKTTLSLRLSAALNLTYQSIDRDVRWLPGWQVRDRGAQRAILERLVAQDRWVMDGSNPSTFDLRLPRADLILWLRLSRWAALFGVGRRVLANYGRVRVAMAEGCPEPFPDREFLHYIWAFERVTAPRFIERIDRFGAHVPVCELASHKAVAALLADMERADTCG